MAVSLVLLVALGVAVVVLTRVVVRGIELCAAAGGMSSKTKGQFLGYATSLPELVGTVGTAGNGLLAAGLWNVGSSNVINWALFTVAALWYRRLGTMFQRKFADEAAFAFIAFLIPLFLAQSETWAASPLVAGLLFAFFVVYLFADKKFNPAPPPSLQAAASHSQPAASMRRGIALIVAGILGIVLAGNYLGQEAEVVVTGLGVPEWAVGWILGFITSLPEMTAFFAVFASARVGDAAPRDDTDCQENLDSLAASNMANLGFIYPVGVVVFVWFAS